MRPAIIIPVYNHSLYIGTVVSEAQKLGLPVYVVDDGCTDATPEILKALPDIHLLHHARNMGKGAAIVAGFAAAWKDGCNWALTLDGDGQHRPDDAANLLAAVKDGTRCIVVGNRQGMSSQKNVPWSSRFGRKFSNFWVRVAGGPRIEDSQSGFRLYPLPEALYLKTRAKRYQFEVEILVHAHQQGLPIREVAIRVIYQEKGRRISHFHPWLDFFRNSRTFARLICLRIVNLFRP